MDRAEMIVRVQEAVFFGATSRATSPIVFFSGRRAQELALLKRHALRAAECRNKIRICVANDL